MVNEEKVILMTRMAAFAAHEGKKDTKINEYFRSDYIGFELVKSAISGTIIFVILFAVYLVSNFESIIGSLFSADMASCGRIILGCYLVVVVGYCAVSYIIYSRRYAEMRNKMKKYYNDLRKLRKMYEKE